MLRHTVNKRREVHILGGGWGVKNRKSNGGEAKKGVQLFFEENSKGHSKLERAFAKHRRERKTASF